MKKEDLLRFGRFLLGDWRGDFVNEGDLEDAVNEYMKNQPHPEVKKCEECGEDFRPVNRYNLHCQACQPCVSLDGKKLPEVTIRELKANKKIGWYVDNDNIVKQLISIRPRRLRVVGYLKPLPGEDTTDKSLISDTVVREGPQ